MDAKPSEKETAAEVSPYLLRRAEQEEYPGGWWGKVASWGRARVRRYGRVYRRGRRNFKRHREEYDRRRAGLPVPFRTRLAEVYGLVRDRRWFEAVELVPLLERLEAAVVLAESLRGSNWTRWDRKTFAFSEDHATLYRLFRYLVQDLRDAGTEVPSDFAEFPFDQYALWEIREIFDLVNVLLESDAQCRPSLRFSQ